MRTTLLSAAALAAVIAAGLVHGAWTNRWQRSAALEEGVARLAQVPRELGAWAGEPLDMDARQMDRTGGSGYVARRYVTRFDRGAVSGLLLCGRARPGAGHT